jgi:hypothetical protein
VPSPRAPGATGDVHAQQDGARTGSLSGRDAAPDETRLAVDALDPFVERCAVVDAAARRSSACQRSGSVPGARAGGGWLLVVGKDVVRIG